MSTHSLQNSLRSTNLQVLGQRTSNVRSTIIPIPHQGKDANTICREVAQVSIDLGAYNPSLKNFKDVVIKVLGKQTGVFSTDDYRKDIPIANFMAQVILQIGTNYLEKSRLAFQKYVNSLWDAFVEQSDIQHTKNNLAPLVSWNDGPLAFSGLGKLDNFVQIISMPSCFSRDGILVWLSIPHEVGHTLVESCGLINDLNMAVNIKIALTSAFDPYNVNPYFTNRVSESAADVIAVLLNGPMAAIGLIGTLRNLGHGSLSCCAYLDREGKPDIHLADALRSLLVAYSVQKLPIDNAKYWFDFIMTEVIPDFAIGNGQFTLANGQQISLNSLHEKANAMADAIMNTPLPSLNIGTNSPSLSQVYSWNNSDENTVIGLINKTNTGKARHVIAAIAMLSLDFEYKPSQALQNFLPNTPLVIMPTEIDKERNQFMSEKFQQMVDILGNNQN